jgi:hypothetical protein
MEDIYVPDNLVVVVQDIQSMVPLVEYAEEIDDM